MTAPRILDSYSGLTKAATLEDVLFLEVSGKVLSEDNASDEEAVPIQVGSQLSDDATRFRALASVHIKDGTEFTINVAAVYKLDDVYEITGDVIQEFVERSALPTLLPFLREALITTAARLGAPAPILSATPVADRQDA